jgi:hypothetical protein
MGLTVYYEWKVKADARAARRLIKRFHSLARPLPGPRCHWLAAR